MAEHIIATVPCRLACRRCGECCRGPLIVEATPDDVRREPRIAKLGRPRLGGHYLLTCGFPCPFLRGNVCEIHATKPAECAGLEPGRCFGYGVDPREEPDDA